jgi:hypothetical protein
MRTIRIISAPIHGLAGDPGASFPGCPPVSARTPVEAAPISRRYEVRRLSFCWGASSAARWTASHGVGSHAVPPTIECARPSTTPNLRRANEVLRKASADVGQAETRA